jgi:iron(III) transport system substrate-binding protein
MSSGAKKSDSNWPRDEFGKREASSWFLQFAPIWITVIAILAAAALPTLSYARKHTQNSSVIAYCAQDQTYAEDIFRDFQKQTGIKVRAVFDSEAVKTVGLANRLLAERNHPQCDVFWGNEEMRARQLATQEVFRPEHGLAFFGYRSRCLAYNTNKLSVSSNGPSAAAVVPHSLLELTNQIWRGKVALAFPQFGTTAAHFQALRQRWGDAAWENWCRGLVANKPVLVDGNSVVVRMVGSGQAVVGLTDSDDIAAGQADGLPVGAAASFTETLLIPNSAGIVRGAPHPDAAEKLFDYLQQPQTIRKLVAAHALEGVSASGSTGTSAGGANTSEKTTAITVDWPRLLANLNDTTEKLNRIFLR